MLQSGQQLACYTLERMLGFGGMGQVWLGREVDTGNRFAIKVPTDPDYIKFLRREAVMQAAIDHPNVVALIEVDLASEPPFAVMEYIESRSLRQILQHEGRLESQRAIDFLHQCLDGLEAAHKKGILHRDLKPENLLITADDKLKITDFGLGRVQEELARSLILQGSLLSTAGNSIVGTYDYMAPEQRNGAATDPRADLYAIGVILHEMLTGKRPTGNLRGRMEREGVPENLIEVVAACMEPQEYRVPDAQTLRTLLPLVASNKAPQKPAQGLNDLSALISQRPAPPRKSETDLTALSELSHPPAKKRVWWRFR
jgi:serine/threonine protein kinase